MPLTPGRSGKQRRERWSNNLDSRKTTGLLKKIKCCSQSTSKWAHIAYMRPESCEKSEKNRFHSRKRRKIWKGAILRSAETVKRRRGIMREFICKIDTTAENMLGDLEV